MSGRRRATMATIATLALPFTAAPASADEIWFGHATPGGGHAVMLADPDDGESLRFVARCESPGGPVSVLYMSERERVPGQQTGADGMRQPAEGLAVAVIVDGQRFDHASARAQPEEMYGGNEITWTTQIDDPLFPALIRGSEMALAIGEEPADAASLRGSAGPVRAFVAGCSE